jgi:hypothetical protein
MLQANYTKIINLCQYLFILVDFTSIILFTVESLLCIEGPPNLSYGQIYDILILSGPMNKLIKSLRRDDNDLARLSRR